MPLARAPQLIAWLRAAGEPSRLRLLVLCAKQDLSVSDLAHALGQSEPRVCRHLRILCEAGLIERSRNGQWVHYQLTPTEAAAGFVRGLLAQLDHSDAQMMRDLDRAVGPGGVQDEPGDFAGATLRGGGQRGSVPPHGANAVLASVDTSY